MVLVAEYLEQSVREDAVLPAKCRGWSGSSTMDGRLFKDLLSTTASPSNQFILSVGVTISDAAPHNKRYCTHYSCLTDKKDTVSIENRGCSSPSLHPASLLVFQFNLLMMWTPRCFFSSTTISSCPRIDMAHAAVLVLLKSITSHRPSGDCSQATAHNHAAARSYSFPPLMHQTTAELSEYFCKRHGSVILIQSEVYKVNRNRGSRAPALHINKSDLTHCSLAVIHEVVDMFTVA